VRRNSAMRKTNLARLLARRPDGIFVAPFEHCEIELQEGVRSSTLFGDICPRALFVLQLLRRKITCCGKRYWPARRLMSLRVYLAARNQPLERVPIFCD